MALLVRFWPFSARACCVEVMEHTTLLKTKEAGQVSEDLIRVVS